MPLMSFDMRQRGLLWAMLGCLICPLSLEAQVHRRLRVNGHDFIRPPGTSFPHLTYQGGALVAHASYLMVYWGPYWSSGIGLQQRGTLNSFVAAIAPSTGFTGQFAEYQEPSYPVLAGTYAGEKVMATGPSGISLDDTAIQAQITTWITSSVLPVPDANTVYVILPPAGIDVTQGGSSACDTFFGYHNAASSPSGTFGAYRYIVLPYPNCGEDIGSDGPVAVDGMTDTLGHEMAETETDPDSGFRGTGWYDDRNGEIADICAGNSATLGYLGFWFQKVWSNAAGTCIGPASGSSSVHLTISRTAQSYPGYSVPSGAANVLPGFPVSFTLSTDSTTPVALSVSGLPSGTTYSLSQPTVTATSSAQLQVSTSTSPGAVAKSTVTATLNSQQAQFQFLTIPWQQISSVQVTSTSFLYNSTLKMYAGAITVKNTGTQPIGPTLLMGYHALDSRIVPNSVGGGGSATLENELAPNGDFAVQFPDGMLAAGTSVSANVAFSNPNNLIITFTPQVFVVQSATACDLVPGNTGLADLQLILKEALGTAPASDDLNGDGVVNVLDIQKVINGALGSGC